MCVTVYRWKIKNIICVQCDHVTEREEHMNYTIRASVFNNSKDGDSNVKGFCTVVFGNSFKITNIAIVENKSTGDLFVSMPRYLSNERDENGNAIYKDVCNPITKEFREELYKNILNAFGRTVEDEKAVLTVDANDNGAPNFKVSVTPFEREGSQLRGLARIYINDNFVVSNVNIVQGSNGLFVAMPSYKTKQIDENGKDIYRDICYPVTKEFRAVLYKAITEEYENRKGKSEEDFAEYIEQQDKLEEEKKGSQAEKDKKNSKEIDGSNSEKSEVKKAEDKSADGKKSPEEKAKKAKSKR